MSEADFSTEEREFRREIGPGLSGITSAVGRCPNPDRLMAAAAGVELDDAAAILEHASGCPLCTKLSADLAAYEFPGASDAEDRRIRARFPAPDRRATSAWSWLWRPIPAAAIGVAAILLIAVGVNTKAPVPRVETARTTSPTSPAPILPLEKAAVKIPAAGVLIYRGGGQSGQGYFAELAAALAPYRRDDYAGAERALAALSTKYPDRAEPEFYLGVSRLFLNQIEAALESLRKTRARPDATLRDDASWYLAIASERAGHAADARTEAEALCKRAGEYKERACAALELLKSR